MALLFGTMAAYAIARLDFPGKKAIVGATLLIAMFPQIALVTPLFKIETSLGQFDTWLGLPAGDGAERAEVGQVVESDVSETITTWSSAPWPATALAELRLPAPDPVG